MLTFLCVERPGRYTKMLGVAWGGSGLWFEGTHPTTALLILHRRGRGMRGGREEQGV